MYITGGWLSSQARCVAGQHLFFCCLKVFSSSQGATTTLNLGKDSALNFWQLFGESLSMNLARIVIDVFSIKKSDRMMLFSGCFQSRWHHRTLIVIENGSSFETWQRFLGLNRGGLGVGSCLRHSILQGFPLIIVQCWGWCYIFWPLVQQKIWEEVGIQWMVNTLAKSMAYTCSGYGRHVTGHEAVFGGVGRGWWRLIWSLWLHIYVWTLCIHNDFCTFFFFRGKIRSSAKGEWLEERQFLARSLFSRMHSRSRLHHLPAINQSTTQSTNQAINQSTNQPFTAYNLFSFDTIQSCCFNFCHSAF